MRYHSALIHPNGQSGRWLLSKDGFSGIYSGYELAHYALGKHATARFFRQEPPSLNTVVLTSDPGRAND